MHLKQQFCGGCLLLDHSFQNYHFEDSTEVDLRLKFQLDVFLYLFLFLSILALHVSGAIAPILRSTTAAFSHKYA
jgi:hypothetical protein